MAREPWTRAAVPRVKYRSGGVMPVRSRSARVPPRRLDRRRLGAIADGGLAAVSVEPLAARPGTTKGSFYWHFANRDALLDAAIRRWEKETTTDVAAEIPAGRDAPASQFRRLAAAVIERAEHDRVGPERLTARLE
jgi:AcrR family transcriptional regulator